MKTINISEKEYVALSDRDESHFFDLKSFELTGAKLQKAAVAFSNADGGEIILGVKDKEKTEGERWEGVETIERFNGHLQAIFDVKPSLDVKYEFLSRTGHKGYALRIMVEKGNQVCQTSDKTVYVRNGAQSLKITDLDRIQQLAYAKGASSYEDALLTQVPPDVIADSAELASFLDGFSPHTSPLEFLVNANLLDYKTWDPRTVSALLFHNSPSSVLPTRCAVKVTRYETREDDPERDHLADQFTIEAPAYHLIHQTVAKITEVMSSIEVWSADGLKRLEYPPEAIWETVVNAVIHRDYSIADDVQVLIFDNRIEILSPGRLPGYVSVLNILDARFSRNAKLVRYLNRYRNAPNKDLGEGLNTTFQKMKEFGLQAPQITEENNYVKVVLPHAPLAAPTTAILQFLKSHHQITNKQARDITGIKSENLVKIEFYRLRDDNKIQRVAGLAGPKSAWELTQEGKEYLDGKSEG
ncbi:ATP-binding protein [Rhizobium skierniewicense]|uniref:ATP-binding protein n=1 Tax=Rhizobium skierniewicense TaxID=984260 RepID=UPI001573760E|nr:ATP-binding protein [Rhizobium skierniewicense]NTF34266.1 transcriptional regulator [Rhizobium skierniewicense]